MLFRLFRLSKTVKSLHFPRKSAFTRSIRHASASLNPAILSAVPPIQLRDYQEECIQSVLSHLAKGDKRLGVSLATGSGKTVIFTHLIDRVQPVRENANQTMILVHRRELVEQAARHCINAYPTKSVEIEMGNHHASGAADITIASVRSLLSGDRLEKFRPERFKLILVDEAHHIVAPGYLSVLDHFNLASKDPSSPALVGVSATLSRFDGVSLGAALDYIVYHKDYVDMIDEKWLASVIFTTVRTKVDLRKVRASATGDFATSSLAEAVNTPDMNEVTVRTWLAKAAERKSTIVFCVDIAHVRDLTATFTRHGVAAKYVTGEDLARDRDQKLESFKRGEYRVLLNCGVFTEGTDVPNVDCVLLARPTKSRNLLVQMIGRGLRLHPDKENCHVIDMVSSLSTGIVTTPTLFGLDPYELVREASAKDMRKMKDKMRADEGETKTGSANSSSATDGVPRKVTFTDFDNVQDLIQDTSGERHIRALSKLAWVQIDDGQYRLSDRDGSFIAIDKEDEEAGESSAKTKSSALYAVRYVGRLPRGRDNDSKSHRFKRSRTMSKGMTFTDVVHAADTLADKWFVRALVLRDASWRKVSATEGQLAFLNKMKDDGDQLAPSDLTKGAAMDMITRIRFGARGRFKKLKAVAAREERQHARAREMTEHEEVRIGPLAA